MTTERELLERAASSKSEAIAKGLKRFFTGKECRRGHISERFTSSGACVACQYEVGAELYARDRAKVLARQKAYRDAHPEKGRDYHKKWYAKNSAKKSERYRHYRKENSEKEANRHLRYRAMNLEKVTAREKQYRYNNRDKLRVKHSNRRALMRGAEGRYTATDIQRIKQLQRGMCAACRTRLKKHHVDHIIPLALGGSNFPENLQLLCPPCNLKKHAKDPIHWANQRGLLL